MRSFIMAAALLGGIAGAAHAATPVAPAPYVVAPSYDGVQTSSRYIAGHDGTRLAITVYRPTLQGRAATGRLPVIVTQTRSEMSSGRYAEAMTYFVSRGYVWVAQDRRGAGASFGRQTGFVNRNDLQDAKSVIEWAAAQPFSTGKVVTLGCSNQGVWQYGVAALAPKGLVAAAPACASPQFFDDAAVMNGVPIFAADEKPFDGSCPAPQPARGPAPANPPPGPRPVDEDKDGSLLRQAQASKPCNAPMLGQYWLNMPRDGLNTFENYRPGIKDSAVSHADAIKRSKVAFLTLGGWHDAAVVGQLAAQSYWGGRVIMGPWTHGNTPPRAMNLPATTLDLNAETLRWFDFHAKGVRNGAERPGVFYYTANAPAGTEWRQADGWKWGGDAQQTYYFGDSGLTQQRPSAGLAPISYAGRDVRWFDGRYQPLGHWWEGDMAEADRESLSQTGAPLAADTEVTGTPVARLWVSADTPDANVFAVLEDVGPDGKSTYVTDGHLRASWRKLAPSPWGVADHHWHRGYAVDLAPLVAGQPAELVFDFFPVSYVFKAGHRMRVSLATSIGQAYQAPPLAEGKAPTLALYRDAQHPSAVLIPIVQAPNR